MMTARTPLNRQFTAAVTYNPAAAAPSTSKFGNNNSGDILISAPTPNYNIGRLGNIPRITVTSATDTKSAHGYHPRPRAHERGSKPAPLTEYLSPQSALGSSSSLNVPATPGPSSSLGLPTISEADYDSDPDFGACEREVGVLQDVYGSSYVPRYRGLSRFSSEVVTDDGLEWELTAGEAIVSKAKGKARGKRRFEVWRDKVDVKGKGKAKEEVNTEKKWWPLDDVISDGKENQLYIPTVAQQQVREEVGARFEWDGVLEGGWEGF
ncbi:hypothetical protein RUND412_008803 [Rhizina undulata]